MQKRIIKENFPLRVREFTATMSQKRLRQFLRACILRGKVFE
jgi:hypothetical protein